MLGYCPVAEVFALAESIFECLVLGVAEVVALYFEVYGGGTHVLMPLGGLLPGGVALHICGFLEAWALWCLACHGVFVPL